MVSHSSGLISEMRQLFHSMEKAKSQEAKGLRFNTEVGSFLTHPGSSSKGVCRPYRKA
jgi:hypothetical protein